MIRWGIAGPGEIATRFAEGMREIDGGTVVAVGSRSLERAEAFAARFDIARSLRQLRGARRRSRRRCRVRRHAAFASCGRHVAVPLRRQARALREAVRAERDAGERDDRGCRSAANASSWKPCGRASFRPTETLRDLLDDGRDRRAAPRRGELRLACAEVVPTHRHFDLAQGGGALLDLGVYTVNLSQFVLGPVEAVVARGHVGTTGVDEHVAAVLQHADDRLGVVQAAIRTPLTCTARIAGTAGVIDLPAFMHCPDHLVVRTPAGEERIDASWEGEGLRFQVEEVHRCLDGRTGGEPGDAVARDDRESHGCSTTSAPRSVCGTRANDHSRRHARSPRSRCCPASMRNCSRRSAREQLESMVDLVDAAAVDLSALPPETSGRASRSSWAVGAAPCSTMPCWRACRSCSSSPTPPGA